MADVDNQHDSSFPVKRKSDICCQNQDNPASKTQKLNPSLNSESKDGGIDGRNVENLNSSTEEKIGRESSISPEKAAGSESEKDEINGVAGVEEEQECGNVEEDEDEQDEGEEEDYESEDEIDTKGKGISRDDKGKGILIDGDVDSDDDDDVDESDLSDDPLAEVDLDNILPSRTRRRSIQPRGVQISNPISDHKDEEEEDDDDDSSYHSDA